MKSKNDKIDAKGLAQMCAEQHLKIWSRWMILLCFTASYDIISHSRNKNQH
ncbi:MAG: hypothetical protein IPO24_18110 [Bacteroidetes bacterium]|nr:hypothetical protein [Bacteroidota bacterium]